MKKPTSKQIKTFQDAVYSHFEENGRDLPWRNTKDPYHVLVSEVMLQQTQVDRVIPKYKEFLAAFPTIQALAGAPLREVLSAWQGLGYNRRAKFLREAAKKIITEHEGDVPSNVKALEALPGIGPATARSIAAFAFNKPVAFIETNVRSVYIHHFFTDQEDVADADILFLVEQTLDTQHPRRWYNALMDYGTHLKKENPNPSRKSKHHTTQSKFEGSDRQIRGELIRLALAHPGASEEELLKETNIPQKRARKILSGLVEEGLLPT